jgi:hypothetical protein
MNPLHTFRDVIAYLKLEVEYAKISLQKQGMMAVAVVLSTLMMVIPFSLFILIASFALGWMLGSWIGVEFVGLFIIAFVYLLIGLWVLFRRKQIIRYFFNLIFQATRDNLQLEPTEQNGTRATL